ncbi:hypothetical protein SAMN05660477_00846 [Soonwooa buanensis]|uniref:Uncharacterized protein n=1 Tax=Soonwooa buanensis TaxID=619805 RepID=A0A1T5DMG7_9FLAO|nr:hypothetical protein [Soonwooa buanensis]SKB72801.1 hypothetical protein SAMN05660477_00846 [Soonwooa buanensis]
MIKKKKIAGFLFFIACIFTNYAQTGKIGIGTRSPQSVLDVNGDVSIRKKLYTADASGNPSPGKDGQILVSQGPGLSPVWKTLRVPDYEVNKYYLIFNDSFRDFTVGTNSNGSGTTGQGISFAASNADVSGAIASTDLVPTANFTTLTNSVNRYKEISGLRKQFTVNSTTSTTYFLFETVVQNTGGSSATATTKYACGIFVDDILKSLRINGVTNSNASGFVTHTQIGAVDNLSTGTHTVKVACARLNFINQSGTIGIGSPAASGVTNMNNFMTQSSLKVDVYEIPQNFSPIITP